MTTKGCAHRINTCYVNGLRSYPLFKAFEKIFNEVYGYLCNSNVRYKIFKFLENENNIDLELIKTHEIRWISIQSAIYNFNKLYNVIVETLYQINTDKSKDLKKKIVNSTFVFMLNWSLGLCDCLNETYLAFQSDSIFGMEIHEHILNLKIKVNIYFTFSFFFFLFCFFCILFLYKTHKI